MLMGCLTILAIAVRIHVKYKQCNTDPGRLQDAIASLPGYLSEPRAGLGLLQCWDSTYVLGMEVQTSSRGSHTGNLAHALLPHTPSINTKHNKQDNKKYQSYR